MKNYYLNSKVKKYVSLDVNRILHDCYEKNHQELYDFHILKLIKRPTTFVLEIEIENGDGKSERIFLKYFKTCRESDDAGQVIREYETNRFWYDKFRYHQQYNVPEPIYVDTNDYVIITKAINGQNLLNSIVRNCKKYSLKSRRIILLDHIPKVGKWLKHFQNIRINAQSELMTLESLIDYVTIRTGRLTDNHKIDFDQRLERMIIEFIRNQWFKSKIHERRMSNVHTDFSLSNVIVDGGSVTVLDFKKVKSGSIFADLTRIYHQLTLLEYKPHLSKKMMDRLKQLYLTGYGFPNAQEIPFFKIYFVIHSINHLCKFSRYWEHSVKENIYNRWVVHNSLKKLKRRIFDVY
jgi:hypothetical protein